MSPQRPDTITTQYTDLSSWITLYSYHRSIYPFYLSDNTENHFLRQLEFVAVFHTVLADRSVWRLVVQSGQTQRYVSRSCQHFVGDFCEQVFIRKLAYVSSIHIYVEQDNDLDNITSLKVLLLLVTMKREVNSTYIICVCFLALPLKCQVHYVSIWASILQQATVILQNVTNLPAEPDWRKGSALHSYSSCTCFECRGYRLTWPTFCAVVTS